MTMNENSREFKAGDRVRYVGSIEHGIRRGYTGGYETGLVEDGYGDLLVVDQDGDTRTFFSWEWQRTPQTPSQPPQTTPTILPSKDALDRFEALLGRLEAILGGIGKGEVE